MSDIPDVPWEIRWDQEFEEDIEELKDSGSFSIYRKQILTVIEKPVREGKYKSESYKGLKTVHVSGNDQDVICFELTPGINNQSELNKLEEIYFHHIDHWDNYDSALSSRQPADGNYRYEIQIPYFGGQYDPERVKSDVYDLAKDMDNCHVGDEIWENEYLGLTGKIGSEEREQLEEILPSGAEVEFNPPTPF